MPIIAALALAITGLVVGALLVSFLRPGGGGVANASPTGTPVSSLPVFVQPTPTATAGPSEPPQSFPGLPTPTPSQIVAPTDTPFGTPPPSGIPTPTPTNNPTPTPTHKPTPPPTPTPTPTPTGSPPPVLTCAAATGTPTDSTVVGSGNSDKKSKGWCIESATFRFVVGSAFGTVYLTLDGKKIAHFSCPSSTGGCPGDNQVSIPTKLAQPGAVLSWTTSDCTDPAGQPCTAGMSVQATIEVGYERATTAP